MEGKLEKNDFIELRYIGKIKDNNEIFDTNIEEEAKKLNLDIKTRILIICLGQNMILPSIDEFLIGKEPGNYILELEPKKAFGIRSKELIKTMPVSIFSKHNVKPEAGMVFSFDNLLGKITTVSGGRVIVDFNNPLAGKQVVYNLQVKRKITNEEEKIKALFLAFFSKEYKFKVENKKLIIEAEKNFVKIIELFKEKFKEILGLDLEASESLDSDSFRTKGSDSARKPEDFRHAQKSQISDIREIEEKSEEKAVEKK